jgi:hypothetical protein
MQTGGDTLSLISQNPQATSQASRWMQVRRALIGTDLMKFPKAD